MSVRVQQWVEPPPKRSQGGRPRSTQSPYATKHRALISELRERPGKWAELDYGTRSATSVFSELAGFDGFEFTTRTTSDGVRIFGRCLDLTPEEVAS